MVRETEVTDSGPIMMMAAGDLNRVISKREFGNSI